MQFDRYTYATRKCRRSTLCTSARSPLVHDLAVLPLEERAHLRLARQNGGDQLARDLLLHLVGMGDVPLLQAQLALPAEQQHEEHLRDGTRPVCDGCNGRKMDGSNLVSD